MKRKMSILVAVVLTFAFTVLLVVADGTDDRGNQNDPTVNERANACYEGGSMEGKCSSTIEWQAGWYLIRYEYGLLSRDEIPAWVIWVLPPEVVPEELAPNTGSTAVCASVQGGSAFAIYVNDVVASGTMMYFTSDCATETYGPAWTDFVRASSQGAALALCQSINASYTDASNYGDSYACVTAV